MGFLKRAAKHEQIKHCVELLVGHTVGNRGVFDGEYYQQLFGLIAQTIVADLVGAERPKRCQDGPDPGYDVMINGMRMDVKCVLRDYPPRISWACNLTASQINYPCDGYLFMSYDKGSGVFSIVGWDTKARFLQGAKHNKVGDLVRRDNGTNFEVKGVSFYEKPISQLQRIRTLDDLRAIRKEEA